MNSRSSDRTLPKSPVPNRIKSLFHCFDGHEPTYSAKKLQRLHSDPGVFFLKDFLNKGEIEYFDRICTHYSNQFRASFTEDDQNSEVISDERTSNYLHLTKSQDRIIRTIEQRAADLVGLNPTCVEPIQIVRYTDGQKFEVHHDAGTLNDDGTISLVNPRRLVTLFVYLNDLPEGEGHTEFPALKMSVKPTRGCGVMFSNVLPNGECDPRTIHQANSVSRGLYKYGLNIWLCDRDLQDLAQVVPSIQSLKIPPISEDRSVLTLAQRLTENYAFDRPARGNKQKTASSNIKRKASATINENGSTTPCSSSSFSSSCDEGYWDEYEGNNVDVIVADPSVSSGIAITGVKKPATTTPRVKKSVTKATSVCVKSPTKGVAIPIRTPSPAKKRVKNAATSITAVSLTEAHTLPISGSESIVLTTFEKAPDVADTINVELLDDWRSHYANLFDYHEEDSENTSLPSATESDAALTSVAMIDSSQHDQENVFELDLIRDLHRPDFMVEARQQGIEDSVALLEQDDSVGIDNSDCLSVEDFAHNDSSGVVASSHSSSNIPILPVHNNIIVNCMFLPSSQAAMALIQQPLKCSGSTKKTNIIAKLPRIHKKRKRKSSVCVIPQPSPVKPCISGCPSIVSVSGNSESDLEACTIDSPTISYGLGDELDLDSHQQTQSVEQNVACYIRVEPSPLLCSDPLNEFEMELLQDLLLDLTPDNDDASHSDTSSMGVEKVSPASVVDRHWASEIDDSGDVKYWPDEGHEDVTLSNEKESVDGTVPVPTTDVGIADSLLVIEVASRGQLLDESPVTLEAVTVACAATVSVNPVAGAARPRSDSSGSDDSLCDEDIYDLEELQRLLIKQRKGNEEDQSDDSEYW